MTDTIPYIRVFISSPGDVNDERKIALDVIEQLPYQPVFRDKVAFRIVAWDKPGGGTSMRMTMTPQDAINRGLPKPSECDIVVVLFWSRMGTPFVDRDGQRYESGTHWELMDAIHSDRSKERTVVYRRTEEKRFGIDETDDREQYERLVAFFGSDMFVKDGVIKGGVNQYQHPDNFREQFTIHFQELVLEVLQANHRHPLDNPTPQDEPDNDNLKTISAQAWDTNRSPFPGLRAFTEDDADIFFGRGRETDALVTRLTDNRFVAVIGSSGSGKSSLVGAGLIPRLRANAIEGSKDWKVVQFTPTDDPFNSLFNALVTTFDNLKTLKAKPVKDAYMQSLRETPETLNELSHLALEDDADWAEIVLFIDQFEELMTLSTRQDAQAFVNLLSAIADNTRVRVVVTMRADFFQSALQYAQLADMLGRGAFPLALPRREALQQMIENPAERAGITFERGLIKRILDDVGDEPGNLALMAYALDELYKLDDDGELTTEEYELLGGVQGAIGTRADNLWAQLDLDESHLHQVFLRLIEVDERGTATRRRAELSEDLDTESAHIIEQFVQSRLLTASQNPDSGQATVEVAHEAILREWKTLANWIDERQADFRIVARMRRDAQWWDSNGRREQDLPRQERIDEFEQACENLGLAIDEIDRVFAEYLELDERERLIQRLTTEEIDKKKLDYIWYRLREISVDEVHIHIALLINPLIGKTLKINSIRMLGELRDDRAIEPLATILDKEEHELLEWLGKINIVDGAIPNWLLADDEIQRKHLDELLANIQQTLFKLGATNAVNIDALILILEHGSWQEKMQSAKMLGELGNEVAIKPLIRALNDSESWVRNASLNALRQFPDHPEAREAIAKWEAEHKKTNG